MENKTKLDYFEKIKKDKIVLNKESKTLLEVAILTIERGPAGEVHFVLGFGGGVECRIVGQKEWQKFLDFLQWFDWNPNDTGTFEMEQLEEDIPLAEEVDDISFLDTWEREVGNLEHQIEMIEKKPGDTLELIFDE